MTTNIKKPPGSKRKPLVKMTKDIKQFILDEMVKGYDILQIVKKHGAKLPAYETIMREQQKDPEFKSDVSDAYDILLMRRLDELHEISSLTATEAYPHVEDWRQAEAALKRRIDEAKFVLGKMSPILSKRFDKAQKLEVAGEVDNKLTFVMPDWYALPQHSEDSRLTSTMPNQVKGETIEHTDT